MKPIEFFWEGTPPRSTAQTRRHTTAGTYRGAANAKALATLRAVVERYAPLSPFKGAVVVSVSFTFHKAGKPQPKVTRPDCDNLAKDFMDALAKSRYYLDDSQVVDLRIRKFFGPISGIYCCVSELCDA